MPFLVKKRVRTQKPNPFEVVAKFGTTCQSIPSPRGRGLGRGRKGIGKTVLQRLQQMGLDDVATLAAADLDDVLEQGAKLTGSTCWKNSPQARAAMQAAVAWAQQRQATEN